MKYETEDVFMSEPNKCVAYGLEEQIEALDVFYKLGIVLIKGMERDREMDAWLLKQGKIEPISELSEKFDDGKIKAYSEYVNLLK